MSDEAFVLDVTDLEEVLGLLQHGAVSSRSLTASSLTVLPVTHGRALVPVSVPRSTPGSPFGGTGESCHGVWYGSAFSLSPPTPSHGSGALRSRWGLREETQSRDAGSGCSTSEALSSDVTACYLLATASLISR